MNIQLWLLFKETQTNCRHTLDPYNSLVQESSKSSWSLKPCEGWAVSLCLSQNFNPARELPADVRCAAVWETCSQRTPEMSRLTREEGIEGKGSSTMRRTFWWFVNKTLSPPGDTCWSRPPAAVTWPCVCAGNEARWLQPSWLHEHLNNGVLHLTVKRARPPSVRWCSLCLNEPHWETLPVDLFISRCYATCQQKALWGRL